MRKARARTSIKCIGKTKIATQKKMAYIIIYYIDCHRILSIL